jgi:hypothetical protein
MGSRSSRAASPATQARTIEDAKTEQLLMRMDRTAA